MKFRLPALVAVMALGLALTGCNSGRAALAFEPAQLPDGILGLPYAGTVTVTQNETPVGDVYIADGVLPPGLSLEFEGRGTSSTAQITGTPTATGTFGFTVAAWCLGTNVSGQTGEKDYTLVIN